MKVLLLALTLFIGCNNKDSVKILMDVDEKDGSEYSNPNYEKSYIIYYSVSIQDFNKYKVLLVSNTINCFEHELDSCKAVAKKEIDKYSKIADTMIYYKYKKIK